MAPRTLAACLVVAATVTASAAQPLPRARTTFATTTVYRGCTTSWIFACLIPDEGGGHHGTAAARETCTRYRFAPDGAVEIAGELAVERARYRIAGRTVTLSMADGRRGTTRRALALSADGEGLGDLRRVLP
jgi:hypothetical protein